MVNRIFLQLLQGMVEMRNQYFTLHQILCDLVYELQKRTLQLGLYEMEHSWIVHLILLLMEQVELSCILRTVLWYSQMVLHLLLRSLGDCLLSYMHRERERVRRMQ